MTRALLIISAAAACTAVPVRSQVRLELDAGLGYSIVDVEAVAESDGAVAQDWNQFMYRAAVRAFFSETSSFQVGAELGYQYFYWYQVRIPYGDFPITRAYDHSGETALGVLRLTQSRTVIDFAGGLAFVGDTRPMVSVAVGREVIPNLLVRVRADALLTGQFTAPLGVSVSYALNAGGQ